MNWSEHNFALEQKDGGIRSGSYAAAVANRTVPNGMKDFSHDMLEKNAHLCSVLNAPLPNSAIRAQQSNNRLPLANKSYPPFTPGIAEQRRIVACSGYLPQPPQQQCLQTFNNGSQTCCSIYSTLPVMVPGNRTSAGVYCDSNMSVRGCRPPPVNGMLVSYAETRNGYCTNIAGAGMTAGQPVPCRSYGPAMQWSVAPPPTSPVNSEFICKVNGVTTDVAASSSAPRSNTNTSTFHLSAVMVSTVDSFVIIGWPEVCTKYKCVLYLIQEPYFCVLSLRP